MDYNKSLQKYVKKIIKLFMDLRFFLTSNTSFLCYTMPTLYYK